MHTTHGQDPERRAHHAEWMGGGQQGQSEKNTISSSNAPARLKGFLNSSSQKKIIRLQPPPGLHPGPAAAPVSRHSKRKRGFCATRIHANDVHMRPRQYHCLYGGCSWAFSLPTRLRLLGGDNRVVAARRKNGFILFLTGKRVAWDWSKNLMVSDE